MSLTIKVSIFTSLLCLTLVGAFGYLAFDYSRAELERSIGQRLEAIASTAALEIDGTLHDQITAKGDEDSEAFKVIRDHLRRVKEANGLKEEIYTFRRVGSELQFVAMSHEKPFIGDTYTIRKEMLPTLNDGRPAHTSAYSDEHGEWISAYAPILDQQGHASGLLEVDIRVGEFLALARQRLLPLLWKGLVIAAVAVVLSFLLARTVTKRLVELTELTEKISLGKVDAVVPVKGNDEVATLARALDRMRESVKIAAELLG